MWLNFLSDRFFPLTNFEPYRYNLQNILKLVRVKVDRKRVITYCQAPITIFCQKSYNMNPISRITFYLVSHNTVSKTGVNRCACVASIWSVVGTSAGNIFVHSVVQTIFISIHISIIKFQPLTLMTLDLLGLAKFVSNSKVIITGIASHSGTTVLTIFVFNSVTLSTSTLKSRSNCATTTFDCYNLDFFLSHSKFNFKSAVSSNLHPNFDLFSEIIFLLRLLVYPENISVQK